MKTYSFEKLLVWQKSKKLAVAIYKITREFPKEEVFGMTSQMRRCSVSIASNIAEGAVAGTAADIDAKDGSMREAAGFGSPFGIKNGAEPNDDVSGFAGVARRYGSGPKSVGVAIGSDENCGSRAIASRAIVSRSAASRAGTSRVGERPKLEGAGEAAGAARAAGCGGTGREPGGSSAMILRIEARMSSMLGSLLASSLVIPHLLEVSGSKCPARIRRLEFPCSKSKPHSTPTRFHASITVAGCRMTGNATPGVIPEGRHSQGKKQ